MMETVLCIFTYRRVFMLDVDAIARCQDEGEDPSPPLSPPPPSMRMLDFLDSGLPLGMGLLKLGNTLYMFGGEFFDPRNDLRDPAWIREDMVHPLNNFGYHSVVYGAGLLDQDPPGAVYALDLGDRLSEPVKLGVLLGPKLYAMVEEIGGRVYVLSTLNVSLSRPLFEVWDPRTQTSRALPNPPSFSECRTLVHHCVVAGTILCRMANFDLNRFHIASERWECVEGDDSPPRERLGMKGRFDPGMPSVFVCRRKKDLRVWAEVVDGDMELMLDPSKTQPEVNGFFPVGYFSLADTSQQGEYMCGLVPYQSDIVYGFALYVFLFQVEKHESALSVRYLRRQLYDFTYIRCGGEEVPLFGMDKAVVGRVSPHTSAMGDENEDHLEKKQRGGDEAVGKQAKREKITI